VSVILFPKYLGSRRADDSLPVRVTTHAQALQYTEKIRNEDRKAMFSGTPFCILYKRPHCGWVSRNLHEGLAYEQLFCLLFYLIQKILAKGQLTCRLG